MPLRGHSLSLWWHSLLPWQHACIPGLGTPSSEWDRFRGVWLWGWKPLFRHWRYWKIANVGRKSDLWEEDGIICISAYDKFTSIEKALNNLLLMGILRADHVFKMREANICFVSETSKSLICLDNSTFQDGNSSEFVLLTLPRAQAETTEPGHASVPQAMPTFLLRGAARCRFGLFRCNNSHWASDPLQARSARRGMPAVRGHQGGGCPPRNGGTVADIGTEHKMPSCPWKTTS